ncbi:putative reverse transcriptase zinc-binding domain-containing protein [Helianthus anomalus]
MARIKVEDIPLRSYFKGIPGKDKWQWLGDKSGDFSVKFVRSLLQKDRGSGCTSFVWCKWLPLKVNVFAWRADLNRLPTIEGLRRRNVMVDDQTYVFCNEGEDSVSHLFIECVAANVVWNMISGWCHVPQIFASSFQDLMKVYQFSGLKDPEKSIFQGVLIIACWSLWKARNEVRFRNKPFRIEKIISEVKSVSFLWVRNRTKFKNLSWANW